MKYISLSLALSIALVGCQNTPSSQQVNNNIDKKEAKPSDIHRLLIKELQTGNIETLKQVKTDNKLPKYIADKSLQTEYVNVWDRIKDNLTLDIPINENVIKHRNIYLKNPTALNNLLKRAEPFLFYIVEKLDENYIPLEIALLPLVESAFNPHARSSANASGLWQFVAATGKQFGLQQNWWYDGRRDVVASTDSAVEYLKYLHTFFDGDWMLALAAYNSGEGRVQRAVRKNVRKNRPSHYWELELPKETRDYVPKLLAVIDIIQHSEKYKINLHPIANKKVVGIVDIGSQIDLSVAANLANLPLSKFKALNPGFNQWATDPNFSTRFLLPNDNITIFNERMALLPQADRMVWQRYQIKQGDSLGIIAQKFHLNVKLIKTINKLPNNKIRAGKHLLIPVASKNGNYVITDLPYKTKKSPEQVLPESAKSITKKTAKAKRVHTIRSGDTLWEISKAYNVSAKQIAKWNKISTKSTLKLGQKLVIWKTSTSPTFNSITYKVKRGDSFARIANKFNVSIKNIEMWNDLTRKEYLQPGQKLIIDVDTNG